MASDQSIDRADFGHWLSGFVDGEGHFHLRRAVDSKGSHQIARLQINLRHDDLNVLEDIKAYWGGIGRMDYVEVRTIGKPQSHYEVIRIRELMEIIIPHFERYPLRAKKQKDFIIWRRGVEMIARIKTRKLTPKAIGKGSRPRWTTQEVLAFDALVAALREERRYKPPGGEVPPPPNPPPSFGPTQPFLFD